MHNLKLSSAAVIAALFAAATHSNSALAQVGSGNALKNSQENITALPKPTAAPTIAAPVDANDTVIYLKKLTGIEVKSEILKDEITGYFLPFMGKNINNGDVKKFKEWAWNAINNQGVLGTVEVSTDNQGGLVIDVALPKIGSRSVTGPKELVDKYQNKILAGFKSIKNNSHVDTLDIDQRMYNLNSVLPVDVNVTLQPEANNLVSLVFNVSPKVSQPGKFKYGAIQINDYGLTQFGRGQGLLSLNYEGFTPGSEAAITVQGAQGMLYEHLQYSAPTELLNGNARVWVDNSNNKNINNNQAATKGKTTQYGLALTNTLGSDRAMMYQSDVQITKRNTRNENKNSGLLITDEDDKQARLKLSADNSVLAKDNLTHLEVNGVGGTDNQNGKYSFMTVAASYQKNLSDSGLSLVTKVNGQALPSRNLDSYNRMSLGGVNGVRAYSSTDGVGDTGAAGTIEFRKAVEAINGYVGLFYDGGVIKENKEPVAKQYNQAFKLQAVGLTVSGAMRINTSHADSIMFASSVAKGIGGYAAFVPGIYDSTPNGWRFNLAVTMPLK